MKTKTDLPSNLAEAHNQEAYGIKPLTKLMLVQDAYFLKKIKIQPLVWAYTLTIGPEGTRKRLIYGMVGYPTEPMK